jgi:hypothetical protein
MEAMFLRNVGWVSKDYMAHIPEDNIVHDDRCENLKSILVKTVGR